MQHLNQVRAIITLSGQELNICYVFDENRRDMTLQLLCYGRQNVWEHACMIWDFNSLWSKYDMKWDTLYTDTYSTLHPNEDQAVLTSVVSGISTFSISLGWVNCATIAYKINVLILPDFSRGFVGPIVGGALVQISDFPTSSLVSKKYSTIISLHYFVVLIFSAMFITRSWVKHW